MTRAKGEIFNGLRRDGTAVLNADDARVGVWQVMVGDHRTLCFGLRHKAEVTAAELRNHNHLGCAFKLCTPAGTTDVTLPLPGRHNVMNALAATSAALALGIPLDEIRRGLEGIQGVSGRLTIRRGINNSCLLDDSYNANPGSMRAALEVLMASDGEKILVLGDMAELGNASRAQHEQVGRQARAIGIDRIYTLGPNASLATGTFGPGSRHFDSHQELIAALREDLKQSASPYHEKTVLVKGSRSMHMEQVVEALCEESQQASPGGGNKGNHDHAKQSYMRG